MSKRIVIIGGGIVGLCTAYYCALAGHRVTVVERDDVERDDGCSFANAGMIVPSHVMPLASPGVVPRGLGWLWNAEGAFYVKPRWDPDLFRWGWTFFRSATSAHVDRAAPLLRDLHCASRACYEEWAHRFSDDIGLTRRGLLMLCQSAKGFAEEMRIADYARRLGIDAQVLTPAETARLEPNVRMTIAGAIHFPIDAHLQPGRLMAFLRREVERAGAELRHRTSVNGWRVVGNRIDAVRTTQDDFRAEEFVVCAGVWSSLLVRELGLALPLQAGKGYSVSIEAVAPQPSIAAILSEARIAVTPMGDTLRFGGTMELSGIDERPNAARVRGIVNSIGRYLPEFAPERFEQAKVRSGLRPCSPDGLPYIGRFSRFANLSTASGHAMMGVSLGPITGKLMAELLSDAPMSCAVDTLRPDRYA